MFIVSDVVKMARKYDYTAGASYINVGVLSDRMWLAGATPQLWLEVSAYHTMARRPVNKSIKQKTLGFYKKCQYCRTNRDSRGFDKHLAACKVWFAAQNENRVVHNVAHTPTTPTLPHPLETADPLHMDSGSGPSSSRISEPTSESVPQSSVAKGQCCS